MDWSLDGLKKAASDGLDAIADEAKKVETAVVDEVKKVETAVVDEAKKAEQTVSDGVQVVEKKAHEVAQKIKKKAKEAENWAKKGATDAATDAGAWVRKEAEGAKAYFKHSVESPIAFIRNHTPGLKTEGGPQILAFDARPAEGGKAVKQEPHKLQVNALDPVNIYWRVQGAKKLILEPGHLVFEVPEPERAGTFESHLIIRPQANSDYMLIAEGEKGKSNATTHISVDDKGGGFEVHTWLMKADALLDKLDPWDWRSASAVENLTVPYELDSRYDKDKRTLDKKDDPRINPDDIKLPPPEKKEGDDKLLGGNHVSLKWDHDFKFGAAEIKIPYGKMTEWGLTLGISAELSKEGEGWDHTTEYDIKEKFTEQIESKIAIYDSSQIHLERKSQATVTGGKASAEFSAEVSFPQLNGTWNKTTLIGGVELIVFQIAEPGKEKEALEHPELWKGPGTVKIFVAIEQSFEYTFDNIAKGEIKLKGEFHVYFVPDYSEIFKTTCSFLDELAVLGEFSFAWPVVEMIKEVCNDMAGLFDFQMIDQKLAETNDMYVRGFREGLKSGTRAEFAGQDGLFKMEYDSGSAYGAKVFEDVWKKAKATEKAKNSGASEDDLREDFRRQLGSSSVVGKACGIVKEKHSDQAKSDTWRAHYDKWGQRTGDQAMTAAIFQNWFFKPIGINVAESTVTQEVRAKKSLRAKLPRPELELYESIDHRFRWNVVWED